MNVPSKPGAGSPERARGTARMRRPPGRLMKNTPSPPVFWVSLGGTWASVFVLGASSSVALSRPVGEEWGDLASEYSIDESNKEQGGDLSWFSRGRMVETFEEAAFAAEIGEIVGPVETDFGWHLIEILGHEDRELDASSFGLAVSQALNALISEIRETAEIEILDYWVDRVPSPRFNPGG